MDDGERAPPVSAFLAPLVVIKTELKQFLFIRVQIIHLADWAHCCSGAWDFWCVAGLMCDSFFWSAMPQLKPTASAALGANKGRERNCRDVHLSDLALMLLTGKKHRCRVIPWAHLANTLIKACHLKFVLPRAKFQTKWIWINTKAKPKGTLFYYLMQMLYCLPKYRKVLIVLHNLDSWSLKPEQPTIKLSST